MFGGVHDIVCRTCKQAQPPEFLLRHNTLSPEHQGLGLAAYDIEVGYLLVGFEADGSPVQQCLVTCDACSAKLGKQVSGWEWGIGGHREGCSMGVYRRNAAA